MADGEDQEVRELLRPLTIAPIPEPSPDLVARTLRRAEQLILTGEILRFLTLEAIWGRLHRRRKDAQSGRPREDA